MSKTITQTIILRLERALAVAQSEIDKFQERLVDSPAYAFEWSQNAFDAAAMVQVARYVIDVFNEAQGDEDAIVNSLRQELERRIRHAARFPSRSTSATSNLMEQSKAKAAAEVLELFE